MKLKSLLFISSGLATVALIAIVAANLTAETVKADYATRQAQASEQGIKGAQEYQKLIKSNVNTGEIEPEDILATREAVKANLSTRSSASEINWVEMGPNNVGGRTRALAAVDNNTLYAGSVSGGLWVSYNAGNNWSRVEGFGGDSELDDNLMVSSLAIAGNGDILVGTGSRFESPNGAAGSGFLGGGLFISTDNGDSFSLVEGTQPTLFNGNSDWTFIEQLRTDPLDPNKVWIAFDSGLGYYNVETDELYDPTQEGALPGLSSGGVDDIQVTPDGSVMLAANRFQAVYRSLDGGETWEDASTGLPGGNRVELAISPDDPNYMYALFSNNGSMGGAYASTNMGESWEEIWPGGNPNYDLFGSNGQGFYDNIVIAKKGDPETAFFGGVTLWKCGATTQQPEQIAANFAFGTSNLYVHSDIHEFMYTDDGTLYIGTDGGVFKSTDNGETFSTSSKGYNTIQFYDIAHSSRDNVMGGTQDNGTLYIPNDGTFLSDLEAVSVMGGDGFGTEISKVTADPQGAFFGTIYYGDLRRSYAGDEPSQFYSGDLATLFGNNDGEVGQFFTCIELHENTDNPNSEQYVVLQNPYDSTFVSDEPTDFTVFSENMAIPYTYTLPAGDTLRYWEELVRPEVILDEELGETDPNYFWLETQILAEIIVECDTVDSTQTGTDIEEVLNPIDSCYTVQTGPDSDTTICIVIGYDTTTVETPIFDYTVQCDSMYRYAEDVQTEVKERIRVLDPYTSMLAIGFQGSAGIWLTRQGLDFNTTPEWYKVVPSVNGYVTDIEFSKDGNHMFYTTTAGRLYRLDGLQDAWTAEGFANLPAPVEMETSSSVAMDVAVDPNDNDHVIVVYGNYGGSNKVKRTTNATSATPTFSNVWNLDNSTLNAMPVYSCLIDVNDPDRYLVGTEFGIYLSENAGDSWEQCNTGDMEKVPVYTLDQQIYDNERFIDATNAGFIYAGTHGRGIFKTEDYSFTNVDEEDGFDSDNQAQLLVYPNPTSNNATLEFVSDAGVKDATVKIYNISGKLMKTIRKGNLPGGKNSLRLDLSELPVGNYILSLEAGKASGVSKFVIMR